MVSRTLRLHTSEVGTSALSTSRHIQATVERARRQCVHSSTSAADQQHRSSQLDRGPGSAAKVHHRFRLSDRCFRLVLTCSTISATSGTGDGAIHCHSKEEEAPTGCSIPLSFASANVRSLVLTARSACLLDQALALGLHIIGVQESRTRAGVRQTNDCIIVSGAHQNETH